MNALEIVKSVLDDSRKLRAFAVFANHDAGRFEAGLIRLRERGVKSGDITALRRAIKMEQRKLKNSQTIETGIERTSEKVLDIMPDAPVSHDLVIPFRYKNTMEGIFQTQMQIDESGEGRRMTSHQIANAPVVIVERFKDIAEGSESVRLACLRDGDWQQHTVDRKTISNARDIVTLAGIGYPVTSNNASDMVEYLSDFESANISIIKPALVSRQMGWQGEDGKLGFLLGRCLICPDGNAERVSFLGADAGDEQIADGFQSSGNLNDWLRAVHTVSGYPKMQLGLFASLATPLLQTLGVPNFIVDFAGPTSTGKSTALRLAASCWGNPDERSDSSAMWTWESTHVWRERAVSVLNGIPFILDEAKRVRNPKDISNTIYAVASGKGRGRGSLRGMRRSGSGATILISSGETPLTSYTNDGGTRARVMTLWGSPFDCTDSETASIVNQFNLSVKQHYGHAGPAIVKHIVRNPNLRARWREEYTHKQGIYLQRAGDNPVAGRFAPYLAILDMAADIFQNAVNPPWNRTDFIEPLWDSLMSEASEADRARAALQSVLGWCRGNTFQFHEHHKADANRNPPQGWAGRWCKQNDEWYVAFYPHRIDSLLSEMEYDGQAILRTWRDRNWIDTDGDRKRFSKKIRVEGEPTWMVVIRKIAVQEVDGVEDVQLNADAQQ